MSEVRILISIARPAEQVWSLLGRFDWLPRWLDVIASSTLSDGGRLRHLKTADGAIIVERLLTFDEDEKHYSYALLEGPSPVTDYVGTMSAKDDGNGGHWRPGPAPFSSRAQMRPGSSGISRHSTAQGWSA